MNSNAQITLVLWLLLGIGFTVLSVRHCKRRDMELGRFRSSETSRFVFLTKYLDRFVRRHTSTDIKEKGRILITVSELTRLRELGAAADEALVRYVVLREGWIAVTLAVCVYSLVAHSATFAAIFTSAAIVLSVWVPRGLLDLQWEARQRGLRLEIPIVIGLLGAGVQAGTEVVRVFEEYADTVRGKHTGNSLADSLVRAQACSRATGSWRHGIQHVRASCRGALVGEVLDGLATAMRSDMDGVAAHLSGMVAGSEESLMDELRGHHRLVVAKVTILCAACVVGGFLLGALPIGIRWGG